MTPPRTHTFSWEDPQRAGEASQALSGIEWLQALARGDVPPPPVMKLVGVQLVEAAPGRTVFTLRPAEYHYNPGATVHGGVISTLLDTAMACAVFSLLPAGVSSTTIELHVNFLRPVTIETGELRCEGETIHAGRTIATAQGRVLDAAGKLCAHATTTCMIMR